MTDINPYAAPSAELASGEAVVIPNPHTLWKQIVGLTIASIILFFFGGIFLVLTGVFTFVDAWSAGIYKRPHTKSFLNISPMAWGIAMEAFLLITFPLYLIKRNSLKTRKGNVAFFALTIVFGTLTFVFPVVQLLARMSLS